MRGKVEICGINTARLPVLKNDEMMALLRRTKTGDKAARERLICGNLRLVLSVLQRFQSRGENVDDLFQVGCIGLMKAIDNFDINQPVRFSTSRFQFGFFCLLSYSYTHRMVFSGLIFSSAPTPRHISPPLASNLGFSSLYFLPSIAAFGSMIRSLLVFILFFLFSHDFCQFFLCLTSGSNETIQNCKYCRCSQKSNKNNDISHGFSHLKKRPQIPFGSHSRTETVFIFSFSV